jgi:hypothetical protein
VDSVQQVNRPAPSTQPLLRASHSAKWFNLHELGQRGKYPTLLDYLQSIMTALGVPLAASSDMQVHTQSFSISPAVLSSATRVPGRDAPFAPPRQENLRKGPTPQ